MDKATKQQAHYRDHPNAERHCGVCTMFVEPDSCTAVQGRISRQGWCRFFKSRFTRDAMHHDAVARAKAQAARLTDKSPSDGQKEAGNYSKGKFQWHGLTVAIETPKGAERSGTGKDGKRWSVKMPANYGYVHGTMGRDGDHVDVYIGDDHSARTVFVIDQVDAGTGRFDEHKAFIDFANKDAVLATYAKAFSDGKAKDRIGAVNEMTVAQFKRWLESSDTKKPLGHGFRGFATGGAVMPLIKSGSRAAISSNISEMEHAGHPHDQAVAAALDTARRYGHAGGGSARVAQPHLQKQPLYARGGFVDWLPQAVKDWAGIDRPRYGVGGDVGQNGLMTGSLAGAPQAAPQAPQPQSLFGSLPQNGGMVPPNFMSRPNLAPQSLQMPPNFQSIMDQAKSLGMWPPAQPQQPAMPQTVQAMIDYAKQQNQQQQQRPMPQTVQPMLDQIKSGVLQPLPPMQPAAQAPPAIQAAPAPAPNPMPQPQQALGQQPAQGQPAPDQPTPGSASLPAWMSGNRADGGRIGYAEGFSVKDVADMPLPEGRGPDVTTADVLAHMQPRHPDILDTLVKRERVRANGLDPDKVAPLPPMPPMVHPGQLPIGFERPRPEIRNTNELWSDWVAQRTNPEVGRRMQQFLDVGKALERTPVVGPIVQAGEELTGTPSMTRGGLNIKQGIEEGSIPRVAGGVGEATLGALPAAASVRALRPALSSVPGIVTAGGAAYAANAGPAIAEEQKLRTPKATAFEAVDSKRAQLENAIKDIMATPPPALPKPPGPAGQNRRLTPAQMKAQGDNATAAYQTTVDTILKGHQTALEQRAGPLKEQLAALQPEWERAHQELLAEQQADLPLRQRYPIPTMALSGIPYVVPTLAGGAMGYKAANNVNREVSAYRNAMAQIPIDVAAANRARDMLRNLDEESIWRHPGRMAGIMGSTALGTTALESLPEVFDAQTGSEKAREIAREKLMSPYEYWLKERAPVAVASSVGMPMLGHGIVEGVTGSANKSAARAIIRGQPVTPPTPTTTTTAGPPPNVTLGPTEWPQKASQAARGPVAQNLGNPAAVAQMTPAEIRAALLQQGITPSSTGTNIERRLAETQDMVARRAAAGTPMTANELMNPKLKTSPFTGRRLLSIAPIGAAGIAIDQGLPRSDGTHLEAAPESSRPEQISQPASTPSGSEKSTSRPSWASDPPEGIKLPKDVHWDATMQQPRHSDGTWVEMPKYSVKRNGKQSPSKAQGNESGTKSGKLEELPKVGPESAKASGGGVFARALAKARSYARGGRVTVGPVMGNTPGRADKLPVKVPAGSFVVPADVVSHLGDGNTGAGMAWLTGKFGAKEHEAIGGAIEPADILISDGEFVVPKSSVIAYGNGNLEAGHRKLERDVLNWRAQHIAKLNSLPGPSR